MLVPMRYYPGSMRSRGISPILFQRRPLSTSPKRAISWRRICKIYEQWRRISIQLRLTWLSYWITFEGIIDQRLTWEDPSSKTCAWAESVRRLTWCFECPFGQPPYLRTPTINPIFLDESRWSLQIWSFLAQDRRVCTPSEQILQLLWYLGSECHTSTPFKATREDELTFRFSKLCKLRANSFLASSSIFRLK